MTGQNFSASSAIIGHWTHQSSTITGALHAFSFAGQNNYPIPCNPGVISKSSDFALVDLDKPYPSTPNTYQLPRSDGNRQAGKRTVVDVVSTDTGPVQILRSPVDIRTGYILEGDSIFLDRTAVFSTKKIQTDMPLECGVSGAWVLSDGKLAGVMIAIYDDEPYAHMLPISQFFSDIKALLGNGVSHPVISLPR